MTTISPAQDPVETATWLDDLLNEAATARIGVPFLQEYITLEAVDDGHRLGGIHARFAREWVFIELLAVDSQAQGRSIGRKLVQAIEEMATARAKTGIWLDTYSFQAPGFYERMDYTRCGSIPDYPPGHSRHFYAKRLDGQPLDADEEPR